MHYDLYRIILTLILCIYVRKHLMYILELIEKISRETYGVNKVFGACRRIKSSCVFIFTE